MKEVKTVYLYAPNNKLDFNLSSKELKNKYKVVQCINSVQQLFNLSKSSIDYLIIFANRKKINNLDKHQLNYLSMIFNKIVVVANTRVNVLNNYTFIPKNLVNNSLQIILKIIENFSDKTINYSYNTFIKIGINLLNKLGFNLKHKGSMYIVDCAYYIAIINTKRTLYNVIYKSVAQKYNTTPDCIERCIRTAINYAICKECFNKEFKIINNVKLLYSNKNIIKSINKYIINTLL